MSEQPLISGRGTCWKDKRSPNTYRYYFSLGVKDPKTGRYKRSPTYTVRCKTKTEAKAAMQAKLAEINSSGTITKDDMRKPLGPPPPRRSFFPRARDATMGFEYRPVR